MSLESDVKLLAEVPLLAEFGEDRLRLIAFSADNRRLDDGARLFSRGERAEAAYVVASGAVALTVTEFDGSERLVARCGRGTLIDERALVVDAERVADAHAVGDTEIIQIRRTLFRRILEEYPDVAERLIVHFSARLQGLSDALASVGDRLDAIDD
ncbi:cyclic nucleotide-binding domain-containing protein [Methylobrevis albus]|uniref:Crp/Fnr family transcriptional regulator n=1 Tax=Methylobrevis albus TaxID=2793297 RepID=A0A931I1P7_9HYPH|nr:Crp/Fnr family transcriptional regulator [Methylobrevis albus]MBH0237799.1 Crp/Fnr family transcriptional regulator [Methylobrevis albus]